MTTNDVVIVTVCYRAHTKMMSLYFFLKPVFHLRKNSHEIKKEDIEFAESGVYVTFDQCNVFYFSFCAIFFASEKQVIHT